MTSTPAERVMHALRGGRPNNVPFTIYTPPNMPRCTVERQLRNRGLCLVKRMSSYRIKRPNVETKTLHYTDRRGRNMIRTKHDTPNGTLTTLEESIGSPIRSSAFTNWTHEHLFESPDDYEALESYIRDAVVEPAYDGVQDVLSFLGGDTVVRDNLPHEPLQMFVSEYMGPGNFGIEWMKNRSRILELYNSLVDIARECYPIVADGPLEFANYGGNVIPQLIGPDNFREYYLPHYEEAADVLHSADTLLGTHLDDDNTLIMDAVADSPIDYIEAFDPGMGPSVSEARGEWPDKVLWLNWPSTHHNKNREEITDITLNLIDEAGRGDGFIIGITENIPENPTDQWQEIMLGIMDGIERHAEVHT